MSRPRIGTPPPIYPDGMHKRCSRCGETKPWSAYHPRARNADQVVTAVRPRCRLCESLTAQERWAKKVAAGPEARAAEIERRREWHRDRMANDPEYADRVRETARENAKLRYKHDHEHRERVKAAARERSRNRDPERENRQRRQRRREKRAAQRAADRKLSGRLPIAPLREWLNDVLDHEFAGEEAALAAWLGVHERRLYAWLHEQHFVQLDVVDRALCHAGMPHKLAQFWEFDTDTDTTEAA